MNDKIKVAIADDNVDFSEILRDFLSRKNDIEIVGIANDGEKAVELFSNSNPDVALLDIIMPKKDGIYVLEEMKNRSINKKVIVETSYDTDDIIHMVGRMGASYFISKPYDFKDLENRILDISSLSTPDIAKIVSFADGELQMTITKMLHELGIPSHIKGYSYIREGITILYDDPKMIGNITKKLYPELAKRYNTTTSRVERAMRHAIEVGWTRSDWKFTEDLFGQSVDFDKAKPTNSEFLVTLADKLRLDNNKVHA